MNWFCPPTIRWLWICRDLIPFKYCFLQSLHYTHIKFHIWCRHCIWNISLILYYSFIFDKWKIHQHALGTCYQLRPPYWTEQQLGFMLITLISNTHLIKWKCNQINWMQFTFTVLQRLYTTHAMVRRTSTLASAKNAREFILATQFAYMPEAYWTLSKLRLLPTCHVLFMVQWWAKYACKMTRVREHQSANNNWLESRVFLCSRTKITWRAFSRRLSPSRPRLEIKQIQITKCGRHCDVHSTLPLLLIIAQLRLKTQLNSD